MEAFAHLDLARTPPTIVKISPILPDPNLHLQKVLLVAVQMIHLMKIWLLTMVTDTVSNCRSDEDEDDSRSPVYATRPSVHGETADIDW